MRIDYRPIAIDGWLPDRCLAFAAPVDIGKLPGKAGCPSLEGPYTRGDRRLLIDLYREVIERHGCCGYVAWMGENVVGYNTFFPSKVALRVKFYGWGSDENPSPSTLVHNCLSLVRGPHYRRQGVGTGLIRHSLAWARSAGWQRFEVHNVLQDAENAYRNDQKSCRSFWEQLGFEVESTQNASALVRRAYGLDRLYTMAKDLSEPQDTTVDHRVRDVGHTDDSIC